MNINKIRLIGLTTVDLKTFGAQVGDRFTLKGVDGLGAPDMSLSFATSATTDSTTYQGHVPATRQLTFTIGLNPSYATGYETPSGMRDELYGLLYPNDENPIVVQLMLDDVVVAVCNAWVKGMTPVYFDRNPAVSLVLESDDPYFSAPAETTLTPSSSFSVGVNNPGNVKVGFKMQLTFTAAAPYFALSDVSGTDPKQFTVGNGGSNLFAINDVLTINTIPGQKSITRLRGSTTTDLIAYLATTASWKRLLPGNADLGTGRNIFYFYPISGWTWNYFKFTAKYLGV